MTWTERSYAGKAYTSVLGTAGVRTRFRVWFTRSPPAAARALPAFVRVKGLGGCTQVQHVRESAASFISPCLAVAFILGKADLYQLSQCPEVLLV